MAQPRTLSSLATPRALRLSHLGTIQPSTSLATSRYLSSTCRFVPRYARPLTRRIPYIQRRATSAVSVPIYHTSPPSAALASLSLRSAITRQYLRAKPLAVHARNSALKNYWIRTAWKGIRAFASWWLKRLAVNVVIDGLLLAYAFSESEAESEQREREHLEWAEKAQKLEEQNRREYEVWLSKTSLVGNWG